MSRKKYKPLLPLPRSGTGPRAIQFITMVVPCICYKLLPHFCFFFSFFSLLLWRQALAVYPWLTLSSGLFFGLFITSLLHHLRLSSTSSVLLTLSFGNSSRTVWMASLFNSKACNPCWPVSQLDMPHIFFCKYKFPQSMVMSTHLFLSSWPITPALGSSWRLLVSMGTVNAHGTQIHTQAKHSHIYTWNILGQDLHISEIKRWD